MKCKLKYNEYQSRKVERMSYISQVQNIINDLYDNNNRIALNKCYDLIGEIEMEQISDDSFNNEELYK